ncbi:hypothetical protein F2Q69_00052761 [Brassica cretica]|uniref:RNase H type-1 domain-containing protein n=1 Tax=Brassica cretica TaxID=69181 RepID=A0A8S9MW43_BRACR|nr:hypothetical protein F2Q69_00052761 [Brassica cretica]
MTPIEMKQEQVRSNPEGRNCEDVMKKARSFQLGGWPSWSHVRSSSSTRRAGLVQLGGWPSWSCCRSRSAIRRTGLVQLGGWPNWIESKCQAWYNAKDSIPIPPHAQIVEETQALSLDNSCMVDGSWTSTDQFSGIGWVWKDSTGKSNLWGHRTGVRHHYTRNWKRRNEQWRACFTIQHVKDLRQIART